MSVVIDKFSGFCWGVVRTVQIAEESLAENEDVYVLGHIIHNPMEIQRLENKGLKTISVDDFESIAHTGAKVLVRAHGEPPETYRKAFSLGIEIIDATCPVVTKLQERVRKFYDQGYQVIVFGKKDHAEVIGVRGVCNDECIVVKNSDEALAYVDLTKKSVLFSQTTMDRPTFIQIRDTLKSHIAELIVDSMENIAIEFHAKDTICGQVSGRESQLQKFAEQNDVVIFVAGRASSNGKVLYDVCKNVNPRTYFIEDIDELMPDWFMNVSTVGITGATSTPQWHMNHVQNIIQSRYMMKGN
ncbi:MAG TPA: 4-hydroxy-3-methylbut-2-enyl diphosphate reductase [Candidatus Kapabacteria bacterium]|jgi:4-hydroxy-3-methylbut-2-enyl diphosphate reductase|nr:4-hydroxy-3-methylbut-2-enyl diphosphate reductase [Ignavibacteria bacterium]HRK58442.1 4-hydroxy-3-methylbut-2-enyl diphosphate reductase [Candidatus Kapabacteria bacterium]